MVVIIALLWSYFLKRVYLRKERFNHFNCLQLVFFKVLVSKDKKKVFLLKRWSEKKMDLILFASLEFWYFFNSRKHKRIEVSSIVSLSGR